AIVCSLRSSLTGIVLTVAIVLAAVLSGDFGALPRVNEQFNKTTLQPHAINVISLVGTVKVGPRQGHSEPEEIQVRLAEREHDDAPAGSADILTAGAVFGGHIRERGDVVLRRVDDEALWRPFRGLDHAGYRRGVVSERH